ncbi:LysR family hydrogen peroxide-inducible transcriptional activator/LysR family cyn operon transcriptional activator [Desulfallas thermosapovorans DSM 6562]|uniref:LysR family hydrogen peroxide-inducible transcriptional activator/LysR family cyn operon transcriptional activator n=1 Tax=Desulfallas thermosapovorans DSM 6562 TaxID=1121431 RepID=A0A5S4ZRR4_9FIRM|nr:LysR family hydrogen peroxide-inducible transcriptional activator/LysR family cyn operon transcriptional activator [Desulfallas thermosapovorans DSM 6562]
MEKELDCLLFERIGKRKIRLTEAGVKFFAFSEEIIKKYNLLLDDLNELKGLKKGQLKVAAPFTTLYHVLPVPLEKYLRLFPLVELTILDRSQQNVIELVKKGEVDFGFLLNSMVPPELDFQPWKQVEVVLLVPKNHPLTAKKM